MSEAENRNSDAIDGSPEIQRWIDDLNRIKKAFDDELEPSQDRNSDEAMIALLNACVHFYLAIGRANEKLGIKPTENDMKAITIEYWHSFISNRSMSLGEKRAIATGIAYADGIRISAAGPKDSAIEAAMLMAAHIENIEHYIPADIVTATGLKREKFIKVSPCKIASIDLSVSVVSVDAVKKSISRFRSSIKGTNVFWLNEQKLQFEYVSAETKLLKGLPNKVGRPRKKTKSN